MRKEINQYLITVSMPSQVIEIEYACGRKNDQLDIWIGYHHPTKNKYRQVYRMPNKNSFSQRHFNKELEAYIVQEAMSDLMDNRHTYDWIE